MPPRSGSYGIRRLTHRPVVVHVLGDVRRGVVGGEEELFCLPADQNEPQVNLKHRQETRAKVSGADQTPRSLRSCRTGEGGAGGAQVHGRVL